MEYKDLSLWQMIYIIALVFINCLDNISAGNNSLLIGLTLILLGFFCYENEEVTMESAKQSAKDLESAIELPIESEIEQSTQSAIKSDGTEKQRLISPVNKTAGNDAFLLEPLESIGLTSDFDLDILSMQTLMETPLLSPTSDPKSESDSDKDNFSLTDGGFPLAHEDTSEDPVFTSKILSVETNNEEFLALLDKEFGDPALLSTNISAVEHIPSSHLVEPLKIKKRKNYELYDIPLYIKKRCTINTRFAKMAISGGFDEYLRRIYSKISWFFNGEGNWRSVLSRQTVPDPEGPETLTKPQQGPLDMLLIRRNINLTLL